MLLVRWRSCVKTVCRGVCNVVVGVSFVDFFVYVHLYAFVLPSFGMSNSLFYGIVFV